jgi:D-arabinose 1-dehydrogenase-like Zn-dependent alcohol dehydrogenase
MAVDPEWLRKTRMRNREQLGMAGLGGLGAQSAEDLARTLVSTQQARASRELSQRERAAEIAAQQALASDPQTAALLALSKTEPALPALQIPEPRPIPKVVLVVGGVVALGLVALIAKQVLGGRK